MATEDLLSREKDAAARAAIRRVRSGMRVALGTGSTAAYAVRALAEKFPGTEIDAVASSRVTEELATNLGLTVRPLAGGDRFDVMVDGADEVTPRLEGSNCTALNVTTLRQHWNGVQVCDNALLLITYR